MSIVGRAWWYVDLRRSPGRYPGPAPPHSGVLRGRHFRRIDVPVLLGDLDDVLERYGAAPVADRTPVLAVGSNANPAVMLSKLRAARVDTTVVFLRCRVANLAVGHSAHISAAGYLPAAPFGRRGTSTAAHLLLLEEDQITAVDATEPNYRRAQLDPTVHAVTVETAAHDLSDVTGSIHVYASRHGVLVDAGGEPVRLTRQEDARLAYLQRRRPGADHLTLLSPTR